MNKSRIARDFYRKVFNDNLINLQDGDARKEIVNQFFNDPVNKKAGWHKTKDRRFFRLAFSCVAKENNFNPLSVGVTPTPSRAKTTKGTTHFNVKSQVKNPPPMQEALTTDQIKKDGKDPLQIPSTSTLQQQQEQAAYYSAQSVGQIVETILNIAFSRMRVDPITQNERIALGESWSPIFNKYLSGHNEMIMPLLITIPIVLARLAQAAKLKKEKELKDQYGIDPKKPEPIKKKSAWENMSHGENKTNKE